jgi:two-component system, sensor histidine kinase and response regulator
MPSPEPGSRGHVLVVEDNVLNQIVAVGILNRLGYTADVAENGRDALEALERSAYGAVLMDCRLPVMDGYQATAEIRRREGSARRTPIIAMTASVTQADRDRCKDAGMDDYIAKPVMVDDVEVVLARWVRARPPAPEAAAPARKVLDYERLQALRELEDEDGRGSRLLTRLAAAFLAGAPADLAGLRAAVERGDAAAAGDVAHHLKGAAATLGGDGVVELCSDIEALAGADAIGSAFPLLGRLGEELDLVRAALADAVPGAAAP